MVITDYHIQVESSVDDYETATVSDFAGFQCDHDSGDSISAIHIIMTMVMMMMMMFMMMMKSKLPTWCVYGYPSDLIYRSQQDLRGKYAIW